MAGINFGLSILAGALVVVGLLCLWWRRRVSAEIALMAATPTSKAADVTKLAPGSLVEIKGMLRCAQPLTAEFSQQRCVYFKAEITREEVYYDRDSDGKQQRKTRTTTLHSNIQQAPCLIEDDSGTVAVDLNGAEVEAVEVINQTQSPDDLVGLIGSLAGLGNIGSNTFRRKEFVLAIDSPAYLLGEVQAGGTIGAPAKGSHNKKFVISHKSEEERTKELGSSVTFIMWIAIIAFAAAAGAFVWAVVRGPA